MSLVLPLLLAAAAPPPPAAARWVSDWEDQRCAIVRETGGPTSKTMMVRSVPGTEQAELWWIDPEWQGPTVPPYTHVKVVLKPSGTEIEGMAFGGRFAGQKGFAISNLSNPFLKTLAQSNAMQVVTDQHRTLIDLPLPAAAQAVAALRVCEDDSLKRWGLDPRVIRTLREPVKSIESASKWISDADYPDEAIRKSASGTVLARLKVGPDGRVSECLVVESSRNGSLDAATCRILQTRGRFHPAIDANGNPTTGLTAIRIRWWVEG